MGNMWNRPAQRLLSLTLALALVACAATDDPPQPEPLREPFRVLLLGDSISIGYTRFVADSLADRAHVVRPRRRDKNGVAGAGGPENCAGTNKGALNIDRWLAIEGGEWDVIHFNFGLHDLKRVRPDTGENSNDPAHPHQADPARYEAQLRAIVGRLKDSNARLVFATTTPVPEGDLRPYREPADPVRYNDIARRVMAEEHVPVNDLFRFVTDYPTQILRPANVHFTEEGSRALARQVTEAILEVAGRAD